MNLSPRLVEILREAGYDAVHWSIVGDARADDTEILEWARDHGCIVITHDLKKPQVHTIWGSLADQG